MNEHTDLVTYNARDVCVTDALWNPLYVDAQWHGSTNAYHTIGEPMIHVAIEMTLRGIAYDIARRNELDAYYTQKLQECNTDLTQAGVTINIASTTQVGQFLYDVLKLKPKAFTPGGKPQVNEDAILAHAEETNDQRLHLILAHRHYAKMLSTYVRGVRTGPDGRVHPTWRPWGTVSWRLACRDPNLQNQPRDENYRLRSQYVVTPGNIFVHRDFSQAEFRWQAILSQDARMLTRFAQYDNAKTELNSKEQIKLYDVHRQHASIIFNVPVAQVTDDQRNSSKTATYGLLYGGTVPGIMAKAGNRLSRNSIDKKYFKIAERRLFEEYPTWSKWRRLTMLEARSTKKYVNVLTGAPRIWFGRDGANIEREAVDYCGQGHTAAMMNMAHLRIEKRLQDLNVRPGIVLQIHDALIAECPQRDVDLVNNVMQEEMERPINVLGNEYVFPTDGKVGLDWQAAS